MKINFLIMKKILDGISKISWGISMNIRCIQEILKEKKMMIIHTFREDNNLTDCLINIVYDFVGTIIQFSSNEDMLIEARRIIQEDKQGLIELWLSLLVCLNYYSRLS